MRNALKIVAGIGAFLVLVLIGLFILARTLITAERVKDLVLPKGEQACMVINADLSATCFPVELFTGGEVGNRHVRLRSGCQWYAGGRL